jgi:patatin-like phospholipase/acyl hydrolase
LGFKRWNVDKIASFYDEFASKIFPSKFVQFVNKVTESAKAETELFTEFLAKHLSTETLQNYSNSTPRVFVTATASMKVPEPAILSNFFLTPALQNRYIDLGQSITLVDALRATTAAPTYFPPIQIGDHTLKDGGLIANNPSLVALDIVRSMWKDRGLEVFVSIGTGATENHDSSFKRDANSPASQVVRQALSLATNSEKIHQEVFHHLCEFHETYKIAFPTHYLWLNCSIPADLSSLSVTDPKQLNKLKDLAKESLLSDEMQKKMSVFGSY